MSDFLDYVVEVKETSDPVIVNKRLSEDWILLSVAQDPYATPRFTLGRLENWFEEAPEEDDVTALANLLLEESKHAVEWGPLTPKGALEAAVKFLGR